MSKQVIVHHPARTYRSPTGLHRLRRWSGRCGQ